MDSQCEKEKSGTMSEAEKKTLQDVNDFNEARQKYKDLRLKQREQIKDYLTNDKRRMRT